MAISKKEVLRIQLQSARRHAARVRENVNNAPKELIGYWQRELQDAVAEVRRLERERTS